jgi:protein gp37
VPEKLLEPIQWSRPKMVFVNSMSDLFHERVPDEYVTAVAKVMSEAPWHTYQVLTKRAVRLRQLLCGRIAWAAPRNHIWWGVSIENRKHGLPRIEELRSCPAAIRFLSIEPLLEDLGEIDLRGIHWVIVGGESGSGARAMQREWAVRVLEQCRAADVPFFFKQWGGVHKKSAGRLLDGKTYDEFPEIRRVDFPTKARRLQILQDVKAQLSAALPAEHASARQFSLIS